MDAVETAEGQIVDAAETVKVQTAEETAKAYAAAENVELQTSGNCKVWTVNEADTVDAAEAWLWVKQQLGCGLLGSEDYSVGTAVTQMWGSGGLVVDVSSCGHKG